MINYPVLVLNQSYEPLTVCRARRALVLVYQGKAQMVENGRGEAHAINLSIPLPSVIRLHYMVKRPRVLRKLTRYEIFSRDSFVCQYCGKQTEHLTLDHVIPRYRSGPHTWENVVSACAPCNRKKAGNTPKEANMKLLRTPQAPRGNPFFTIPFHYLKSQEDWQKYMFQ
ncbi:HNH endonuclease [Chloroflexota bacterium]